MSMSDSTDEQAAGTRAGGNVETKGASQSAGSTGGEAGTRAGGNVETKDASGDTADEKESADR